MSTQRQYEVLMLNRVQFENSLCLILNYQSNSEMEKDTSCFGSQRKYCNVFGKNKHEVNSISCIYTTSEQSIYIIYERHAN